MSTRTPSYIVAHRDQLLTEEQEQALFHKWYGANSKAAADRVLCEIISAYSPIVWKYAKRFAGYEINPDDLISEGTLALVEAANRYKIELGFRFATFCRSWVEGLMLAYITKNYFMVNVCSNQRMKKLFFNLRRIVNREMKVSGRLDPSPEFLSSIATKLEVTVDEVVAMYTMFRKPYDSLSEPIRSDEEEYTRESLIASSDPDPESHAIDQHMNDARRALIERAVDEVLTKREKMIFLRQVLSEDDESETLQMLADQLGLSKERVRQIRDVAKGKVTQAILLGITPGEFGDLFPDQDVAGGANAF